MQHRQNILVLTLCLIILQLLNYFQSQIAVKYGSFTKYFHLKN